MWERHEAVGSRYELLEELGKGSFGVVVRATDHKLHREVALKIIRNRKKLSEQALIEIRLLRFCNEKSRELFVELRDFLHHRGHIVLVFELLSINLYELLKKNRFKGLNEMAGRMLTIQLLFMLAVLHRHGVVHTDLKPENVMLLSPASLEVKLGDFGSSCFRNEKVYTYIQSRYYRSPEIMLGLDYDVPIDLWSLGCIVAELFLGYPIFPGESEVEQLALIEATLGPLPAHMARAARKRQLFTDLGTINYDLRKYKKKLPHQLTPLREVFTKSLFVEFLESIFRWEPAARPSAR